MAFLQFPKDVHVRAIDSNEESNMGSYRFAANTELTYAVLTWLKVGSLGGSETLQMNIYSHDDDNASPAYQSNVLTLSDYTFGSNHIGTLRFDFTKSNLSKQTDYTIKLQTANYTRSGDTFYLAWVYDTENKVNTPNLKTGAKISFIGSTS